VRGSSPGSLEVSAARHGEAPREGELDPRGGFRIADLTPGLWRVIAEARATGRRAEGQIEIAVPGETVALDLELGAGSTLEGRLLLNGEPLTAASVSLTAPSGLVTASGRSNAEGRFRLEGLADGDYTLDVITVERDLSYTRPTTLAGDRSLVVELAVGGLQGMILETDQGGPVEGASITLEPSPGSQLTAHGLVRRTHSDQRGRFVVARALAGRYQVTARAEGFQAAQVAVLIVAGKMLELPRIVLKPLPPGS
jgi:hypothetical protein